MPAYTDQTAIEAEVPPAHLTDGLDDDGDGVADEGRLDQLIANAATEIDGMLGSIYTVPFEDPPALVQHAALVFVCENIYRRRERMGDRNPYSGEASRLRMRLEAIGAGKAPLVASEARVNTPGAAITETSRLGGFTG